MSNQPRRLYECGPFLLDPQNRVLAREGEPIPLPPKAFETLLVLVQHRGNLLQKERLLKEVWPATFVEENNLTQYISLLRKVLGDNADHHRYIETVPKLGYRFVAPVREVEIDDSSVLLAHRMPAQIVIPDNAGSSVAQKPDDQVARGPGPARPVHKSGKKLRISILVLAAVALALVSYWLLSRAPKSSLPAELVPRRRSVAVLGFKNLAGNPQSDWLSTALAEMLTTELSAGAHLRTASGEDIVRVKHELKINDNSTLSKTTLSRIRKNLGVDVTVAGSYLELGPGTDGKIRWDIQLQNTADGETIGSIAEVGTVADLFPLVSRTGTQLRAQLGASEKSGAEESEIRAALPASPEAARLYSQGLATLRAYDAPAAQKLFVQAVAIDPGFALGHSALGATWAALGYDENAKKEAARAMELSGGLSPQDRLGITGRYRELTREWDKAVESYQFLVRSFPDSLDYGLRLAGAQTSAGRGKDALATVASLRHLGAPLNEDPQIDLAEAIAAESLGDFTHELRSAEAAASKGDLLGEHLLVARALVKEAFASTRLGESQKAVDMLNQAKDLFSAAGDKQGTASALQIMATILTGEGNYRQAKQAAHQALQAFEEVGDKRGTAHALNTTAIIHYEQGELSEAQSLFEKALEIQREVASKINIAGELGNIANVMDAKGELAEAQKLTEESIRVFTEVGDERAQGTALANLASLLYEQGDLAGAMKTYNEALLITRKIGYQRGVAFDLSGLSEVLEARGDLANARKNQEEALSIRIKIGEKHNVAASLVSLAQLALEEDKSADAETPARQAISQFASEKSAADEALGQVVLARALLAERKVADSRAALERAVSLSHSNDNRTLRFELAAASAYLNALEGRHSQGPSTRANERLKTAITEAERCRYRGYDFRLRLALIVIEGKPGDTARAYTSLRELAQEARTSGFDLIARKAEAAIAGKAEGY